MELIQDPSSTVQRLLNVNEVAVVGVLLSIIGILIYFIIKLRKEAETKDEKINNLFETRIQEEKEYTKNLLEITNKVSSTISQINEMIRISNSNR